MLEGKGGWLSTTITAMANFSTQYNYQCVAVALLIMSDTVCTSSDSECRKGTQAQWVQGISTAAVFIGSIVGQLSLGFLGDLFSRNTALSWTMSIAMISSIISAAASVGSSQTIYAVIIAFRFLLGVGLGGVYPLSAAKSSEDSSTSHDHGKINSIASSWAYFWQLPGLFCPWLLGYIFSFSTKLSVDNQWRLILGLGAVPSFITICLLTYEEILEHGNPLTNSGKSNRHLTSSQPSSSTPEQPTPPPKPTVTLSEIIEIIRTDALIRKKLFGAGVTWLLFDIIVYGISLLSGHIIKNIALDDDNVSNSHSIRVLSSSQMVASGITIFVAAIGVMLVPKLGLKRLQELGFIVVAILSIVMTGCYNYLSKHDKQALFGLYCILFASLNFGLGSTTYSLPAALFHKEIRGTFNGICAAMGKVGAAIGAFTFYYIAETDAGYTTVIALCAFISLLGLLVTVLFIHTYDFLNTEISHHPQKHIDDKRLDDILHHHSNESSPVSSGKDVENALPKTELTPIAGNPITNVVSSSDVNVTL
jgi:PHS family inorganic phosphate transporter-like MFS transporter